MSTRWLKYERYTDDSDEDKPPTDDDDALDSLLHKAKNTALQPLRIATSKPARRAYLTTILTTFAALSLLGLAIVAYTLFYWSYIPSLSFSRTLHLQFDHVFPSGHDRYDASANPYGTVDLAGAVASVQRYDVSVVLELPRTRGNREAGNFMVEAALYAQGQGMLDDVKEGLAPGLAEKDNRVAMSRRPAMVAYRSGPVEWLTRGLQLPWYLVGWRRESETLIVGLWEGVEFARGWGNVPKTMRLEVQSSRVMQVYAARVEWRARLRGMRWVVYNHRIISAVVCITAFWVTELAFAGLAWAGVSFLVSGPSPAGQDVKFERQGRKIKQEPDAGGVNDDDDRRLEVSDTERTFPSSRNQQPLHYQSPREDASKMEVKREEGTSPTRATEADDEDDIDFVDSGLGTSMESSAARRDSVRKRRAKTQRDADL